MKKTLMTFMALGFGCSVALAQAPVENNTQLPAQQKEAQVQQTEKKEVKMEELPAPVQEAFNNGEYKDMEVLAIYVTPATESAQAAVFEFELAKASPEAAASEGMGNVEIEQVSNRQPDIILHINENGELLEEKNLDKKAEPKKE